MKMGKEETLNLEGESGGTKTAEKSPWQLQQDIDGFERQVASLTAQLKLPLTSLEVMQLRTVLADKKEKLGDHDAVINGIRLIEKLDGYINPELPFDEEPEEE